MSTGDEPGRRKRRVTDEVRAARIRQRVEIARYERRRKLTALASALMAMATISAAGMALLSRGYISSDRDSIDTQLLRDTETLKEQIAAQKKELAALRGRLSAIATPEAATDTGPQVAALQQDVSQLSERLDQIDKAILDNPTKALSVPMLRRDLDVLQEAHERDLETTAKQIDRVYDQNKWFIGLMCTLGVSILGLAISNLMSVRKKTE